jgi:mono/diheme cytochrome c family protein
MCLLTGSLAAQRDGRGAVPDAEQHKMWMDDAGDVQEDLREALAAKDGKKTSEAALRIEGLMGQTEAYWNAKRAPDIVALAQASRALSKQLAAAAREDNLLQAREVFDKLSANCNTCHELHPEKR